VVRDKSLPVPERRKARSRTARGGASARKRGAARLAAVEDPGAEDPGDGSLGDAGLRGEEPSGHGFGGAGPYGRSLWGEEPSDRSSGGLVHRDRDLRDEETGDPEPGGEEPGGEEAARVICLRLLTSGPRTRAQLATALRKRRIPDEIADCVLGRFAEVGLIDDATFARAWVESRHHGRGLARQALAAELRQRGVSDGEVRSAVDLLGPQDELAAAQRLVARRVAADRGKPMPVRARQLMGMLARKGYPAGLAAQVVREALEQDQADCGRSADLAWISEDGSGDDGSGDDWS
jgi:regulatory protein